MEKIHKEQKEKEGNKFVPIVCNREKIYLNVNNIKYIERVSRKIRIVCEKGCFMINESLNIIGERLPEYFVRCHTGYIVNTKYINCLKNKNIVIKGGEEISLGRAYKSKVKDFIKGAVGK